MRMNPGFGPLTGNSRGLVFSFFSGVMPFLIPCISRTSKISGISIEPRVAFLLGGTLGPTPGTVFQN